MHRNNPIRKQFSQTDLYPVNGHNILITRSSGEIKFCIAGEDGSGCSGEGVSVPVKKLKEMVNTARASANTSLTIPIPEQVFGRRKSKSTIKVSFTCRYLSNQVAKAESGR